MAVAGILLATMVPSAGVARPRVSTETSTPSYVLRFTTSATTSERQTALLAAGAEDVGEIRVLRLARAKLSLEGVLSLRNSGVLDWIHREGISRVAAAPNDPLFDRQWALRKIRAGKGWRVEDGTSGDPVVVAVADSGVDPSHPDLEGRLLQGFDFVNNDRDPSDDHGHGTHVAGVIAARTDNKRGMAGLSWGARILPLKACDISGACPNFSVVQSIVWAAMNDAEVVNLSLAGPGGGCPPEYELARDFAAERGVVLVAAAGNSGAKGGDNPVNYPAACDGYFSVAASGPNDEWAPFSTHNDYVDVAAPGMGIVSTLPPALTMQDDPSTHGYGPADGTSMAAPHVAGLAALILAWHPEWTPAQVEERIASTAVDLGKRGKDPFFGSGRIDVAAAMGAGR